MAFGPYFVGELRTFTITVRDKDTGDIVDLTDYSAPKVMLRKKGATANRETTAANEDGVIDADPKTGKISYTMKTAWAVVEVGSWTMQVQLTVGTQTPKTEKISFLVESGLVPTTT
jgi:hypothetical protein